MFFVKMVFCQTISICMIYYNFITKDLNKIIKRRTRYYMKLKSIFSTNIFYFFCFFFRIYFPVQMVSFLGPHWKDFIHLTTCDSFGANKKKQFFFVFTNLVLNIYVNDYWMYVKVLYTYGFEVCVYIIKN
jgi:hypothetical protein